MTPARRTLIQDALGVLLATTWLLVAAHLALVPIVEGLPHVRPVGHGWFLFGETWLPLLADHHNGYHLQHQHVLSAVFGGAHGPAMVGLLYASATIALLAMWGHRRLGAVGWLAPLLYAASPFVLTFGAIPSHEPPAIFWLLATWWLLDWLAIRETDTERAVPWLGRAALVVASLMAVLADHGGFFGVFCLAITAAWPVDRSRLGTFVPPAIVAVAACVGAWAALPPDGSRALLITMDSRFFEGFDHLLRVGAALRPMLAWPALAALAIWPLWAVFALLRRQPLAAGRMIGTLYVVGLLETVLLREPGWSSNLAWWAITAALAAVSLGDRLCSRLPRLQPLGAGVLVLALVTPTALQTRVVFEDRAAATRFVQGLRTAQFEGLTRWMVGVADAAVDADETIYLGPGVTCALECLTMGAPKRFIGRDALIADGMPTDGVVIVHRGYIADIAALQDVPGVDLVGYLLLDPRGRLGTKMREVRVRWPQPRFLPRALARPAGEGLIRNVAPGD